MIFWYSNMKTKTINKMPPISNSNFSSYKQSDGKPWITGIWFLLVSASSAGKESASNAGDPGSIPGLGRSAGEGIGYPLQYFWASLVAGKESACHVGDLALIPGLGRSPGKGATHSSILVWRIPWTVQSMELQRVRHDWVIFTLVSFNKQCKEV